VGHDQDFEDLVKEGLAATFAGWDFAFLNGRKIEAPLPWDYASLARKRIEDARSLLDMGTGGGEILASLAPLPSRACATEAYAPNVEVARKRLTPLGVTVHDTTADPDGKHLPFEDGAFDLVLNRHECIVATEVRRVLTCGGRFLTQQCGGYGEVNLIEWFKGKGEAEVMDWTAAVAAKQLGEAGLRLTDVREVYPEYTFLDVAAVIFHLRAIPWLLGDFSVEKYRDRLLAMHRHIRQHGGFVVRDQRFLVEAAKPI